MPSTGARWAAHSCSLSAGLPLTWVSILGTGSPGGGGTPSGIGVPICHEQLEAISSTVAPITATARSQRTGDTGLPQTHSGRCPSSHAHGPDRQPAPDVTCTPPSRALIRCATPWFGQPKQSARILRSEDKSMTAGTDLGVSIHAAAPNITSQLFASGLIGLREGLEAAIVVTILVAVLVKSDRRDALKWVWLGVAAAILMTVAVFLVIQFGENTISGLAAEAIAGIASLAAVAIVTTMILWMKRAAASMSGELRSDMRRALETGSMAVLALAFLAVGREGVETALFMVGYAEAQTAWPLIGLVIGVLIAAAIAYGMYAGAIRINLAKFFKYTGVFLIVVAAGILSYGVDALQTVGWLPGLSRKAFDITSWFNWSSWYGEVIQGIFNVTPTPTVLQFSLWLAYLVIVLAIFLRPTKAPAKTDSSPQPLPESERSTT